MFVTCKMKDIYSAWTGLLSGDCILDVRSKEEFNESHVPGAMHIPHLELEARINELSSFKGFGFIVDQVVVYNMRLMF